MLVYLVISTILFFLIHIHGTQNSPLNSKLAKIEWIFLKLHWVNFSKEMKYPTHKLTCKWHITHRIEGHLGERGSKNRNFLLVSKKIWTPYTFSTYT